MSLDLRDWYLCIAARLDAVWHWARGHRVRWRANPDYMCSGDILCDTCDAVMWCRSHDPWVTFDDL